MTNSTTSNGNQWDTNDTPITDALGAWNLNLIGLLIIGIVGAVGNLLTMLVVIRSRSMRRTIHVFIFGLAVANLMFIVTHIPSWIVYFRDGKRWLQGDFLCKLVQTCYHVVTFSGAYTIVAIAVDRYLAIFRPAAWRRSSTLKTLFMLIAVWVCSCLLALPVAVQSAVDANNVCTTLWPSMASKVVYHTVCLLLQFLIPLSSMIFFYARTVMVVKAHQKNLASQLPKVRVIKQAVILCVFYCVCNLPDSVMVMLMAMYTNLEHSYTGMTAYRLARIIFAAQFALNPFLYSLLRQDFRHEMSRIFKRCTGGLGSRPPSTQYRNSRNGNDSEEPRRSDRISRNALESDDQRW